MNPDPHPQAPRRITLDGQEGVPAPAEETNPDGVALIHRVPTPALELFPAATQPSRGTVLLAPGGGYSVLAIGYEGRDVARMLNDAGWDAAVLLYRVDEGPGTRALALADARQALALLHTRGGEFGLSVARVGVLGFSAGGHLMARLSHDTVADHVFTPEFLVLVYPAYLEKDGKILEEVAPTGVPVFLCVGDQDHTYLPSSEALAAACRERGIRCEYVVATGAGHGFGLQANRPEGARGWPEKLRAFLDAPPGADQR